MRILTERELMLIAGGADGDSNHQQQTTTLPPVTVNGSSASVTFGSDGNITSATINCPAGTAPSIQTGGGNLNLGAGTIAKVVNASGSIGGNGSSVTCAPVHVPAHGSGYRQ